MLELLGWKDHAERKNKNAEEEASTIKEWSFSELLVWSHFEKATDEIRRRPTISKWCRNHWTLSGPAPSLAPSPEPWLLWVKKENHKKNRVETSLIGSKQTQAPSDYLNDSSSDVGSVHFSLAVFKACMIFLLSMRTTTFTRRTKTSLQPESTKVEKTFLLANRPFKSRFQTCNVQHLDNLGSIEPFRWGWREE